MPREPDGVGNNEDVGRDGLWREIAQQITVEKDPVRMLDLCRKLDAAFVVEEQSKVQQSLDGDGDASWKELAMQAQVETDPVKLTELCKKLNEAMLAEERKKTIRRLSAIPQNK